MQVGQWSGLVTDKIGMQFGVPPMKIAQLKSDLDFFISSRTVNFRDLAWVSGFINSLFVAVDLIASLFTRQINSTIQAGWDCTFPISVPLLKGLRFWFLNIEAFDGYGIQPKFSPGVVIFCDYAFGGFQVNDQPVSGMFTPFESQQSSTFGKLKANFYVIQAYAVSLRRKKVKVFTDKENASRIFESRAWEKSDQYGIWTHDLCDTSTALYQLSLQANWELVNKLSKW